MMKRLIFSILIILSIGSALSVPDETCKALSNTNCETCLNVSGCAFCKDSKSCFAWSPTSGQAAPCSTANLQYQTCIGKLY